MSTVAVTPIFWGGSWGNPAFRADKIDGLVAFYHDIGGSGYANASDEYADSKGFVTSQIVDNLAITDLSSAPNNGSQTGAILAEVCKVIANPATNGYYPAYLDTH